jgi:phosphatidate phosphatase PAH1
MINPTGEIRIPVKSTTYKKSYEQLSDLVMQMFPHVHETIHNDEDYGTSNYWCVPLPDVEPDWE